MTTWNYRLIRHLNPDGKTMWVGVHEVYYDLLGTPVRCSDEPIQLTAVTVGDLRRGVEAILNAFEFPILTYGSFQ